MRNDTLLIMGALAMLSPACSVDDEPGPGPDDRGDTGGATQGSSSGGSTGETRGPADSDTSEPPDSGGATEGESGGGGGSDGGATSGGGGTTGNGSSGDGSTGDPGTAGETGGEGDTGQSPIECEGYDEADYPEGRASFTIENGRAIMAGVIGSSTPGEVRRLLDEHPEVEVVVMPFVPGSEDDVANLEAARLLHEAGLHTCLPSQGLIASGGVDFFLAGTRRAAGAGGLVGVHSWAAGNGLEGGDLPRDDPEHRRYLDYYAEIGIDESFYWFTLDAAPSDDVHWMTPSELERYGVLTE